MTEFSNIVIEIIILLLCASLSFAILKIIAAVTEKIQTSSKFLNIDVAIITIAILLFVSAFLMSGSSPKANRTNEKENVFITNTNLKILLIGLDGATWHIADNLLKEGKLPNIEKIISNGSKGDLRSYISPINPFKNTAGGGMFSSALWTSIATGKTPRENGVQDLIMVSLPGMKHPLPFRFPFTYNIFKLNTPKSYHIRTNRIWNILSHYGKFCEVYGWWCTWPVERVNGIMVSMAADNPLKKDTAFYPNVLSKEASEIEISLSAEKESVFRKYFGQKMTSLMEEDANSHNSEKSPEMKRIEILRHDFMRDLFFEEISTKFMKTESDFKAVYFLGPDGIEHAFWKYYEPHYFDDVSDKDVEIFGKIIENYYIFLDEAVGNLYSSIDDDTVTIIISDHGMGPWRRSLFDKLLMNVIKRYERSSGNHRRNGIIIISGKNIKKSAEIKNATIFDIAPTVLHLLGFPVAKDMKGRVLTEVIDDDWLSKFPISYIKSYEGVVKKEIIPELKASDKKDLERLKALGYIK